MPDAAQNQDEILAELAALGLALARDLQARALAAKDDAGACDLALAFHRVSRSLRQTLALQSRLERDRAVALREAANDQARTTLERVQRRRRQVRAALTPLIWTEAEGEEAEALLGDLEALLMEASEDEDFIALPVEACIARIREGLDLPAPDTADNDAAPEVVIWRSSA